MMIVKIYGKTQTLAAKVDVERSPNGLIEYSNGKITVKDCHLSLIDEATDVYAERPDAKVEIDRDIFDEMLEVLADCSFYSRIERLAMRDSRWLDLIAEFQKFRSRATGESKSEVLR